MKQDFYLVDENLTKMARITTDEKHLEYIGDTRKYFVAILCAAAMFFLAILSTIEVSRVNCQYRHENAALTVANDSLQVIINETRLHALIGEYSLKTTSAPTKDSIIAFVRRCDPWYPDILIAQFQMESGFGQSNVAKKNNNICGMMQPRVRETVAIMDLEKTNKFAKYKNWELCVIDRILWDYSVFDEKKPTRKEYLSVLQKRYAELPDYATIIDDRARQYRE